MSVSTKGDHDRAKNISSIYRQLNAKTLMSKQPQTELDKKLKIWRFDVVKRDENAPKISKVLKENAERKKTDRKKATKLSEKPAKTPAPKSPRKKYNKYKPATDPGSLKEATIISRAWDMHVEGKTIKEISEQLNTPRSSISSSIYIRRKQLNLPDPPRTQYSNKGSFKSGTNTERSWKLHLQGYTNQQIADELKMPLKSIGVYLSTRRKQLNVKIPESQITIQVRQLKNEGKTPIEISRILNISHDSVRYHFYKKKPK